MRKIKNSVIYKIVNIVDGKVYIGSAIDFEYRKNSHISTLRRNKHRNCHLQNAWNLYGEGCFRFEIIEEVQKLVSESRRDFKERLVSGREQYYLDKILHADKETNYFSEFGYNINRIASSRLGASLSQESKTSIITHDPVLEMARINDPKEFPYDVFVYGGDSYGSGRNEHGEPHFHFADKIKGGKWQFSIFIPTVEEWKQNKELYIYETSNNDYNWTGLKKEKKSLIIWLDGVNKFDRDKTNLEFIRLQWNVLNIDNKNVSQINKIK